MTTTLELFRPDPYRVVPERPPERSGEQKRRDRQQLRIATGRHPLSIDGMVIPLHPDAPRDAHKGDPRPYPRCGTCNFRVLLDHHDRRYPKCLYGAEGRPPGRMASLASPRISHGADTDVRAWWPACLTWQARPEPT